MTALATPEKLTKGQKTARKILQAAARCISKIGVEKTSVTNIAKEAELKRSLVAYHFPKKDRMIFHVFEMIVAELRSYVGESIHGKTGRDCIQAVFLSYVNFYHDYPDFFRCHMHFFYLASINPEAKKYNSEAIDLSNHRIEWALKQIVEEQNISVDTKTLSSMANGLQMWLLGIILTSHCVENRDTQTSFEKKALKLLNQQIDLMLLGLKMP